MVARGDSLAEILDSLCRLVEAQADDVLASILLGQSRGWSSSVEGCSCNEQMSPPPKSSSGCGCVRRLGDRCFLASCIRLNCCVGNAFSIWKFTGAFCHRCG
jgi:hypothetical protein